MAKTIDDYKKDYASASARGDAAGMQAANSGANSIRTAQGQAGQYATSDINRVAGLGNGGSGATTTKPSGGVSSYVPSGGGSSTYGSGLSSTKPSKTLDSNYYSQQDIYSKMYRDAKANGDWQGMQNANDGMNQVRNQYGMTAERASDDIKSVYQQGGGIGAGGTGARYPFQYGSADDFWNSLYGKTSDAQQAAIDAYIKQQVNGLNAQKSGVSQSADDAARQAYVGYMQSQRTLPQALSASGYSGGLADSQRLGLDTTLQNNQKDILLNRDNALNSIDTAINNAKLEGDIQGAQAQASLGRDAIAAFQSYMNQSNAFANSDYWNKYGYDFNAMQDAGDKNWQAGQSQTDRDWQSGEAQKDRDYNSTTAAQKQAADHAWNLLSVGQMPSDALLAAAGIRREDAQGYIRGTLPTLPTASGGRSSGSTYNGSNNGGYQEGNASPNSTGDRIKAEGLTADIMALGLGPISKATVAQYISSGQLIAVNIDGTTYFKWAAGKPPATSGTGNLFGL